THEWTSASITSRSRCHAWRTRRRSWWASSADRGADSGVYRFGQWRFANRARLEVLEPIGRDGFLHRFLAARGPGLHHVTFKVPSPHEACERAPPRGYEIVGP